MCSILGILDIKSSPDDLRKTALELSRLMRHRGPDWSGIFSSDQAILAHERLAIVDVDSGEQPLYSPDRTCVLAVNGEIYNHRALRHAFCETCQFQTKSDCEIILALYEKFGNGFLDMLQGMFAFCLYDTRSQSYLIARDHMGIIPLYLGRDEHGNLFVSSELKAICKVCKRVEIFPPGCYLDSREGVIARYYHRDWQSFEKIQNNSTDRKLLRESLESSVKSHLMSDVPYGVLLSGGLDSSVIAAIANKFSRRRVEDEGKSAAWWPRLHSFAIGLLGSPDLAAAKLVADHIGTVHHSLTFTVQEGLDALRDVIYHIETYDVTSIRA